MISYLKGTVLHKTAGSVMVLCGSVGYEVQIPARTNVTAMLPVKFALPGKNGINPIMFEIQMKKNTVNKYGVYLSACLPRFGSITSSLMNKITGSYLVVFLFL